jgi:hypothetical protein
MRGIIRTHVLKEWKTSEIQQSEPDMITVPPLVQKNTLGHRGDKLIHRGGPSTRAAHAVALVMAHVKSEEVFSFWSIKQPNTKQPRQ